MYYYRVTSYTYFKLSFTLNSSITPPQNIQPEEKKFHLWYLLLVFPWPGALLEDGHHCASAQQEPRARVSPERLPQPSDITVLGLLNL